MHRRQKGERSSVQYWYVTVAVRTFDSVQGDEANIVLLSWCRNNPARNVGFLNDTDSLLIVATSRAKD